MVDPAPRVAVMGDLTDPATARLADLLAAVVVADGCALARVRPEIVVARLPTAALWTAAIASTVAGAAAVVAVPLGPAVPLPWWGRRFHRLLLPSQALAREWQAAGVALGRLVVVEPGPDRAERAALVAVLTEVGSMARRPGILHRRAPPRPVSARAP
jgi:hypothetical protein